MVSEKQYTIQQLSDITHIPASDITRRWMNKEFPSSFIATEDGKKVVRIPEQDARKLSGFIPQQEPPAPAPPPPDLSKLIQEAEAEKQRIMDEADIYHQTMLDDAKEQASKILADAELQVKEITAKANTYYASKLEQANKDTRSVITTKASQLQELTDKLTLCRSKYAEVIRTAQRNKSYRYNLAMADRWGKFASWAIDLVSGE